MDKLFILIGMVVAAWAFIGLLMLAFAAKVYIQPGAPLMARLGIITSSMFALPAYFVRYGAMPMVLLHRAEMSEEEMDSFKAWQEANCPCDRCRARRGE